ncbi:MAG: 50S ribosomal protein L15 [Gammaproteobacteria bacterium]|nr:50S ribosomal protein L15 [Gammaproteobacteria bacterium]
MRLNSLKPAEGSKKKATRVGRGWSSGLGKTCGKGQKGQTSRGKGKVAIGFEGGQMPFHRRIPKSGFNSKKSLITGELRLSELNNLPTDEFDLETLIALDVFDRNTKFVKVISTGVIERAVTIRGLRVTAAARAAIEAAGGKVEL